MEEQNQIGSMSTQTILSENNQISLLLNLIIEQTAMSPNEYESRIHLVDALYLAISQSLTKNQDKEINFRKNDVVSTLNKMKALPKEEKTQYQILNTVVHTNIILLNKCVISVAHKILNTPFRGAIKW